MHLSAPRVFKPSQEAMFEFLRRRGDGAAVRGCGDFPELDVGIVRVDEARVSQGDVAVELAVN